MLQFHHVALSITDPKASMAFYQCLGFEPVAHWRAEDNSLEITHLKLGSAMLELFCYSQSQSVTDPGITLEDGLRQIGVKHFALQTTDIEQARQALLAAGLAEEIEIKAGRTGINYFFIQDPDGIFVEIIQDDRGL